MLASELKKLKRQIENEEEIDIDKEKLLSELDELEAIRGYMQESLALSGKVCPTCGRRL